MTHFLYAFSKMQAHHALQHMLLDRYLSWALSKTPNPSETLTLELVILPKMAPRKLSSETPSSIGVWVKDLWYIYGISMGLEKISHRRGRGSVSAVERGRRVGFVDVFSFFLLKAQLRLSSISSLCPPCSRKKESLNHLFVDAIHLNLLKMFLQLLIWWR